MAESDVVAELDAELALIEQLPYRVPIHLLAKRARDEIVVMRGAWPEALKLARADALEEAANVADDACLGSSCRAIHAIRALKDKRDE